jgi:hypothetical protein
VSKEKFSNTIMRKTKKIGKIADCFGTWKMTDEEEEAICVELSKGWNTTQK